MYIKTERLILKPYSINNLDDYHALMSNPLVWIYSTNIPHENILQSKQKLEEIITMYTDNSIGFHSLSQKSTNKFIGEAGIISLNKNANRCVIGNNLLSGYWGKGYATEITKSLIAIGWLPNLKICGETIRHLLKDDGFFYVFDRHPFFLAMDEGKMANNILEVKYPYFGKEPDVDDCIGGYASETKCDVKAYFWMYTVSDLINSLTAAGLHIECFNEFKENFCNMGGMDNVGDGLYNYKYNTDKYNTDKFPMSFSLKASVYK